MNKLINLFTAGIAAMVFAAAPLVANVETVSADTSYDLSVPISTIVRGPEGSVHELASQSIEQTYQGMECSVTAVAENQRSVHPGNDLIVASGNSSVVLADVERAGGVLTEANGVLTLGSSVVVSLKMGPDRVFSGGMDVHIECVEKEIQVCRDGHVITIKESELRDSDIIGDSCPVPEFSASIECTVENNEAVFTLNVAQTSGDTQLTFDPANGTVLPNGDAVDVVGTYDDGTGARTVTVTAPSVADCTPDKIEVCRDGEVVSIFPNERVDSDTDAPCPEVKAEVTELPKTGAGSIVGLLGATFAGGTVIAQAKMRRNAAKRG